MEKMDRGGKRGMMNLSDYPRPNVTVDGVALRWDDELKQVQVLLTRREQEPYQGLLALPGGFIHQGESAKQAMGRVVEQKTGIKLPTTHIEQLQTLTEPERDPRGWIMSVVHLVYLSGDYEGEWVGLKEALTLDLAFDHQTIIETALKRVKGRLTYEPTVLKCIGTTFTSLQAQEVYGYFDDKYATMSPSSFRTTYTPLFSDTGLTKSEGRGRPKVLYQLKERV